MADWSLEVMTEAPPPGYDRSGSELLSPFRLGERVLSGAKACRCSPLWEDPGPGPLADPGLRRLATAVGARPPAPAVPRR